MFRSPLGRYIAVVAAFFIFAFTQQARSQTTISSIDQMTGWTSCSSCAGYGGTGAVTAHSLTQNLSSPSLDGKSAQFSISGTTAYANALWWKQLGGKDSAHNFIYDVYYYIKTPTAPQALEF